VKLTKKAVLVVELGISSHKYGPVPLSLAMLHGQTNREKSEIVVAGIDGTDVFA
jgi:hypothetical protein